MRWRGRAGSSNVEDRRGVGGGGIALGGCGTLILIVVALFLGVDPFALLSQAPSGPAENPRVERPAATQNDEQRQFVSVVLKETEDVWNRIFREQLGREYQEPTLVLFEDSVRSGCGYASAAVGPFYCPADQKLYLDFSFFRQLRSRHGAPGDFAQAYVIAHEVGHHVQNLLGITDKVDAMRGRLSKEEYNELSVRLELQADYFAGVWARHTQQMEGILEPGDLEEAIRAAQAVGDDTLQMEAQGYVVPDSFTHGTSEQRARWFRRGFESGDIREGDTFAARRL